MIYLTHLKAHGFKQLQEIELFFPKRCCALVEGLNEAGKSTLFEAVYFALYGKGLAMRGGERASLIAHRETTAKVELRVLIGDTELMISRKINRAGRSEAEVVVVTPGGEELIRGVRDVNDEILVRLNRLDAEALLSSCFVQQKKLGQLEEITRANRQAILLRLLNMERVTKLKERFKWTATDERGLQTARYKYRLAEATLQISQTREGLESLEHYLNMAEIHARLEEIEMHNEEAHKSRVNAEKHKAEADRIAVKISQIESLDKIIRTLDQNIKLRDQISLRANERERLSSELVRIDHEERKVLPSLIKDGETLETLKRLVEEISSLEIRKSELILRSERLAAALKSAAALTGPQEELKTLTALKMQAEEERRKLDEDYSAVKGLEEAKGKLAHLEVEIEQACDRATRLRSALRQAEALGEKRVAVQQLEEELAGTSRDAADARSKHSAAMRIEELTREAERVDDELRRLANHQSRLGSLVQDSINIKELRILISDIQGQLAEGQLRVDAISGELSRLDQSDALINWAAARREADTRAGIDRLIEECKIRLDEALARKIHADNRERSAKRQLWAAGFIIATGLVTAVAAFVLSPVFLALTLVIVGVGVVVAIRGKGQSNVAANERRAAEADVLKYEREHEGGRVRRQMLADSQPRDLSACQAELFEVGLTVPKSPEEAEQIAKALASRNKSTVLAIFNTEQASVQGIEKRLIEQQERLRAEEHNLGRQLTALELSSAGDLQGAIAQTERKHAEHTRRQEEIRGEIPELKALLPAQYEIVGISQALTSCEERKKALELELAKLRAEAGSSEKQIQELFSNEDAGNVETAQALLLGINNALEKYREDKGELERLISQIAVAAPAERTSAELYNQLTNSTGELRRLETSIAEKQARIAAEQERISSVLHTEAAADLEQAQKILKQVTMDEQSLATKISELWERDENSFSQWRITRTTAQAREGLAAAASTVKANITKVNEEIAKRTGIEQQKARTEAEIENYILTIENNHTQLDQLLQEAGLERFSATAERNRTYEVEMLEEAQLRRALEDFDEAKLAHQKAIESKATELSKAEQSEQNSSQAQRSAEMRLSAMGVIVITNIDVETISKHLPDFLDVKASDRIYFQSEISQLNSKLAVLDGEAQQLEQSLQIIRGELDIDICKRELDELVVRNIVCLGATPVLDRVRENILQSVLPNTLNYMRSLLPLLTCGRYHDAELDDETYKIRVWDNRAGEYIEKDIFSGATQDQFSLALRLAFALATLPEGLGAQPKFIFLDEPTAGFDSERKDAFINLLNDGYLSDRFDQIFLIAPEGIFNVNPLPDHVRIERGRIMTDTLSGKVSRAEPHLQAMHTP